MTTGSPTVTFGRRIVSPPSNSISIRRSVPRIIAAVHCRHVRVGASSSDTGLAHLLLLVSFLGASATVPTVRLRKLRRFSGLDCWRGFKMTSRGRTGVATDMVLDKLYLHGVSETMAFS
uniref:Uncharacterized protein n=1 Tax=Hyaloperonospora arabidopsidis (strain Emoy2) TaxID=559515 RepID=M4BA26_HYAAE